MTGSSRNDLERDIDDVKSIHEELVRGAGGTPGGTWLFVSGLVLAAAGVWFFLSNVHVVTSPIGMVSGLFNRGVFGDGQPAMSTGIVFAPIFIGLVLLFHDARWNMGWVLFAIGLAVIVVEILSRIQFLMNIRTSNLLLMLGMVAAGIGMMLRSFRDFSAPTPSGGPPSA